LASGIYLDPGKAGNGQDPHVTILCLVFGRYKVLSSVEVDVRTGAIWGRSSYCARVYTEFGVCASGSLLVPCGSSNVEDVDNVHLRLERIRSAAIDDFGM